MALPASVGFIWHASDRIAVRPEISFGFSSTETETPVGDIEFDSSSVGIAASVLFYTGGTDTVRTYLSPRFEYARVSLADDDDDQSDDGISLSGSFGAQYNPVPRFSVFGEVGLEYVRANSSFGTGVATFETRSSAIGTRSAVGVILYFGGN